MSTAPTAPKGVSADVPSDVDRRSIWPTWLKNQQWRDELHKRVVHKALDIPEGEDMNIDNSKHGLGLGALAAVSIPGMVSTGILGLALMNKPDAPPPVAAPQPIPISQPADSEYDVRFYDKDGNLIEVPRLPKGGIPAPTT